MSQALIDGMVQATVTRIVHSVREQVGTIQFIADARWKP
jgi:hypothetical protein